MKWCLGRRESFPIIPDVAVLIQETAGFSRNAHISAGHSLDLVCLTEFTFLYSTLILSWSRIHYGLNT